MLSLPEDWDYSLGGLVRICTEGKDAINKALKELEAEGYLTRNQIRAERGRFSRTEFIIREVPADPISPYTENPSTVKTAPSGSAPCTVSPYTENPSTVESPAPCADLPLTDLPCTENPPQLSTKELKERKESNTNQSIDQDGDQMDEDEIEEMLRENVEYDVLIQDPEYFGGSTGRELLDSLIEIMKEPFIGRKRMLRIGKEEIPAEAVRSRMMKLEADHLKYVYDCVFGNPEKQTKIRNIKAYLLTALYNAPVTAQAYWMAG